MAIRISKTTDDLRTILKVDGWLKADDVGELTQAYEAEEGPTALDLSELQSADHDGAEVLRKLIALGVEIRAASPYIELLLRNKS